MNLQEIMQQPHGFVPPSVFVKVEKIWPAKTGTGQYGPWSLQNVDVVDKNGAKGKLTFKGVQLPDGFAPGVCATIKCRQGDKGLAGLKVEHVTKDGKTYSALTVDDRAEISFAGGGGRQTEPANHERHEQAQQRTQARNEDMQAVFRAHLPECAKEAGAIAAMLGITEQAAKAAIFATVVIGSKERGLYLTPAAKAPESKPAPTPTPTPAAAPQFDPMSDDIPF